MVGRTADPRTIHEEQGMTSQSSFALAVDRLLSLNGKRFGGEVSVNHSISDVLKGYPRAAVKGHLLHLWGNGESRKERREVKI